jgi:hypothetical protein
VPGRIKLKARAGRVRRTPGEMNGLERRYADYLDLLKAAGQIADWKFDSYKLRLPADQCWIVVDFCVMLTDGTIEFHETKGFMEGDAWLKLKMAAQEHWWFRFVLVKAIPKRDGGGFSTKVIGE